MNIHDKNGNTRRYIAIMVSGIILSILQPEVKPIFESAAEEITAKT